MKVYFNAGHDANSVSTLCGVSDSDGSVMPIQIDPVTGRVMVEIIVVANDSPVLSAGRAAKDANSSATVLGQADDSSGLLVPAIYSVNKRLFVDLVLG